VKAFAAPLIKSDWPGERMRGWLFEESVVDGGGIAGQNIGLGRELVDLAFNPELDELSGGFGLGPFRDVRVHTVS
jgi:hypothetical protein